MDLRKKTDGPYGSLEYEVRDSGSLRYESDIGGFDMDNDLSDDQPQDIERINMGIDSALGAARTLCIIMSAAMGIAICSEFLPVGAAVIIGGIIAAVKMKKGIGWARSVCAVIAVLNGLFGILLVSVGISMVISGGIESYVSAAVLTFFSLFIALPAVALYKMYVPKHVKEFFYRNKRR